MATLLLAVTLSGEEALPDPGLLWCRANGVDLLDLRADPWRVERCTSPVFFWEKTGPTGSLAKPLLLLALARAGVETAAAVESCPPSDFHEAPSLTCWNHDGHGAMTGVTALAHSCNAWFSHRGQGAGVEAIPFAFSNLVFGPVTIPSPTDAANRAALWCGGHAGLTAKPGAMALALLYLSGGPRLVPGTNGGTALKPNGPDGCPSPSTMEHPRPPIHKALLPGTNTNTLSVDGPCLLPAGPLPPDLLQIVNRLMPDIQRGMALAATRGTGKDTATPWAVLLKTGTMDMEDGRRRGWAFVAWPPASPTRVLLASKEGARGAEVWGRLTGYMRAIIR